MVVRSEFDEAYFKQVCSVCYQVYIILVTLLDSEVFESFKSRDCAIVDNNNIIIPHNVIQRLCMWQSHARVRN